jgi:hypothetical protein
MSDLPDRQTTRAHWSRWLLLVPFIAVLAIPFYDKADPAVFGVPFFYWWQLLWILLSGVMIGLVYLIEHRG